MQDEATSIIFQNGAITVDVRDLDHLNQLIGEAIDGFALTIRYVDDVNAQLVFEASRPRYVSFDMERSTAEMRPRAVIARVNDVVVKKREHEAPVIQLVHDRFFHSPNLHTVFRQKDVA